MSDFMTVYHVVTERPMHKGQVIYLDENFHNGVYSRVMTFKDIIDGKEKTDDLTKFIKSDLDKWSKVAYRELALEEIREKDYPNYPSRMACLYTSSDLKSALNWAQFFKDIGRDVFSLVKLKVQGRVFTGDACNCFDGSENANENLEKAKNYWSMNVKNENPVMETLVDGKITVEEIIENYK